MNDDAKDALIEELASALKGLMGVLDNLTPIGAFELITRPRMCSPRSNKNEGDPP